MLQFTMTHNNLNVKDLDKSLEFYEKAFGFKPADFYEPEDHSFKIAYLSDGRTPWRLELTWLADKEGAYELGDNESHVGLIIPDELYEEAHKLHSEMGCICYENDGMGLYFVEDPDGYWIEVEPASNISYVK